MSRISPANTFLRLLVFSSAISLLLTSSDKYVLLKDGLIPVRGGTVMSSFLSSSAKRCAVQCSKMGNNCNGFLLQSTTACSSVAVRTVNCQLLSFSDLGSVVLGSAVDCQQFYVKDMCAHDNKPCMNAATCDVITWPRICKCSTGYAGTYCNKTVEGSYFMNFSNSYYMPVMEQMTWGNATQRCQDIDPQAHLAIIRSPDEFRQLQSYLMSLYVLPQLGDQRNALVILQCVSALQCCTGDDSFQRKRLIFRDNTMYQTSVCLWTGFWTAQRRLDVYAADQNVCLSSPLVWVKNNSTTGLLHAESWELMMWPSGWPADCALVDQVVETCVELQMFKLFLMNDVSCWSTLCPLCQLDA